jgi:hypothetical protein
MKYFLNNDTVVAICRSLFVNKMTDYSAHLRLPSLTDKSTSKHNESKFARKRSSQLMKMNPEFIGIINYSIMALILELM